MRSATTCSLVLVTLTAACVQGNPTTTTVDETFEGGTITPPGCGYEVKTRLGAEAPVLATAELGADPTIKHVHLGIAGDPRTSIAVTWRTVDDTTKAGKIKFGTGGALDREVAGLTWAYREGINNIGNIVRIHEAHLCGLTAGTEYSYQVVSDDGHTSPTYTFRTAPDIAATPDAEVVIATVGDSRDGYEVWAQIVAQLVAHTPDLVVFSGDAVTIGQFQAEWEEFFAVGEPLFSKVPVVSAHGNHDLNSINFYSQFAMPGDEENFSFDYGHAHITVLNDSPEQVGDLTGKIKEFLRADLMANASKTWKIVNHHRPTYSASQRHGSNLMLRDEWTPIIDQYRVDLVLSGHDHDYERSKPMKNKLAQPTAADGTIYVVSGGAGAELYLSGEEFHTEHSASIHSAATVRIRAQLLEFNAFDQTGAMVDQFMIAK